MNVEMTEQVIRAVVTTNYWIITNNPHPAGTAKIAGGNQIMIL